MNQRKVYELVKGFRGGWTSVDGNARSGRSSTVICLEVKEQIHQSIRDNQH
jgi:hypothetical protein